MFTGKNPHGGAAVACLSEDVNNEMTRGWSIGGFVLLWFTPALSLYSQNYRHEGVKYMSDESNDTTAEGAEAEPDTSGDTTAEGGEAEAGPTEAADDD